MLVSGLHASRRRRWIRSRRAPVMAARGSVRREPRAIPAWGSRLSSRSSASTRRTARERSRSPDSTTAAATSRTDPHLPSYRSIVLRLSSESTRPRNLPEGLQELGELPDPGLARDPAARLVVERRAGERRRRASAHAGPRAPRGSPPGRRSAPPPRRRSRGSAPRRHRRAARRRGSAARQRGTRTPSRRGRPRPRPPASGISRSRASESRWSSSERRRVTYGIELEPVAEAEPFGPLAVGRPEVADEAGDDVEPGLGQRGEERPRVAPAEEAAGVRDPEARRGMVARSRRSRRSRAPFAIVTTRPLGSNAACLLGDRVGSGDDRVGVARDEPRDAVLALLLDPGQPPLVAAPVRVGDERVAEVGDPAGCRSRRFTAAPTKCTELGGDVVSTTSIPSRRTIRIAAGIAVRFQVTFSSGTSSRRPKSRAWMPTRSRPCLPCSSCAGRRPRGPT